MEEIEVKIIEIDKDDIEKKLQDLGFKKTFEGKVDSLFFDTIEKSLKKDKKLLRLRKMGEKTYLTHKTPISKDKYKIMEEKEIEVSDMSEMKTILTELGYKPFMQSEKHRISYQKKKIHIDIDTYDNIPTFMEIETEDEKTLGKYIQKLGFKKKDALPWSTGDLKRYYDTKIKKKIN